MKGWILTIFLITVSLFLIAPLASATEAINTPTPQCLNLTFYRKATDKYYYFVDNDIHSSVYYRTSEKDKFTKYSENTSLRTCFKDIKMIDPPQKYMYGVKNYRLDITREISNIQSVSLSSSPAFKLNISPSPAPDWLGEKNGDISDTRYSYAFLSLFLNIIALPYYLLLKIISIIKNI